LAPASAWPRLTHELAVLEQALSSDGIIEARPRCDTVQQSAERNTHFRQVMIC